MLNLIKKIMSETFRIKEENILVDSKMEDIEGWDSISHMELILRLEKELQITLSGEDIAEMNSISSIILVLNKYKAL